GGPDFVVARKAYVSGRRRAGEERLAYYLVRSARRSIGRNVQRPAGWRSRQPADRSTGQYSSLPVLLAQRSRGNHSWLQRAWRQCLLSGRFQAQLAADVESRRSLGVQRSAYRQVWKPDPDLG